MASDRGARGGSSGIHVEHSQTHCSMAPSATLQPPPPSFLSYLSTQAAGENIGEKQTKGENAGSAERCCSDGRESGKWSSPRPGLNPTSPGARRPQSITPCISMCNETLEDTMKEDSGL